MPRCRYLFAAELGDPISTIFVGDAGCMAGTMLGKVWLYSADTKKTELLTAFSDEGIRALYLDEEAACATLLECSRGWRRTPPYPPLPHINFRTKQQNQQNVKHVLQRGPWACVIFPASTVLVHVARQDVQPSTFKLFDYGSSQDVVPCDFDGTNVLVVDRHMSPAAPMFRVVDLHGVEPLDVSLPNATRISLAKLWGTSCIAYVTGGSAVTVYDYRVGEIYSRLHGHHAEVVAMDTSNPTTIATLSCDATVKIWHGSTGACQVSLHVPEASFFLGFPYFVALSGRQVLISADEGVILVELDSGDSH